MIPEVTKERLAEYCDVFCERGYFDLETSRRILTTARDRGLGIRMHADQLTNGGGAELAAELGAVTADHLEQTEAPGIEAMKRAGVQPVLLPGSVYALGKTRYPRARDMIEAGLAVVVATDFNPGILSDAVHANGLIAGCYPDENDACRIRNRCDDQCCLQFETRR
jgi:imidazolonepropionase